MQKATVHDPHLMTGFQEGVTEGMGPPPVPPKFRLVLTIGDLRTEVVVPAEEILGRVARWISQITDFTPGINVHIGPELENTLPAGDEEVIEGEVVE